jgi:anion-transporting  ArsA/GET3 family ATPase
MEAVPPTGVAAILEDKRIVICAGSGGVGKTTTAAALAMGMAARGLRVAVITIDPARRLATSLGLDALGNDPALVDPARFAGHGVEMRGELWAMTLDAKRTFDDLIERLAPDARTRDEVLSNRIYQQLSNAVAGSQEFTAIAKLYELDAEGGFDLLVLDTPPSRNALDFLDAPDRLTGFFQGRAIRMFLRPAGIGGKLLGRGTGVVFSLLKRVTGVDLLQDLSVFFRSLGGMIDGFTERATRVKALLDDPRTTFLLVTSPEREPVQEAIFFHRKLREAGMPFGGLVVNRLREAPEHDGMLAADLGALGDPGLADRVLRSARELRELATRDATSLVRLRDELGEPPTVVVPQLPGDVHDVDGLARVLGHLFDQPGDGAQSAGISVVEP